MEKAWLVCSTKEDSTAGKEKIEEVLVPVVEEVVQSSRVDPPRPCEGVYYKGQWEGTRVLSKEWLDKNEQLIKEFLLTTEWRIN